LDRVVHGLVQGLTQVIDVDLKSYFDNVRHHLLLQKIAKRVQDPKLLHLVKQILKPNGKKGVPQGGVLSPLLANLYLNELDQAMEDEMGKRRRAGKWERWCTLDMPTTWWCWLMGIPDGSRMLR
jgi:RNA-directed DNA polymerase